MNGHAIEVRLYAEDVLAGYLPTSGDIHSFEIEVSENLRVDAGFASGTRVSTFYDSMLAKVIGYGSTRDDARRVLAAGLSRARLHGVVTNRDLLVGILREPEFAAGAIDTGYLTRHSPEQLCPPLTTEGRSVHSIAAALANQARRRAETPVLATLPSGWRNNPSGPQRSLFDLDGLLVEVEYRFERNELCGSVDGVELDRIVLHGVTPTMVDLELERVRRIVAVTKIGDAIYVDSAMGHTALTEIPRFRDAGGEAAAGSLLAPMPGTVVRVEVAVGDVVEAGATIMAIEAMKMEHAILAPRQGVVSELPAAIGMQVDSGTVLAVLGEESNE
jgi:acetyl/propionyl-CoA carboxylase alpha subunit